MTTPSIHLPVLGRNECGDHPDLGAVRAAPQFWRSLAELEDANWAPHWLVNEFSAAAAEWRDGPSRRRFLQLMGASIALASFPGCRRQSEEKIVPYVDDPERTAVGKPQFFATVFRHRGFAQGLLVESHEGRPTKIEGNPDHPSSLGATSTLAQAHVLSLYDPDRSEAVRQLGEIRKWESFVAAIRAAMKQEEPSGGAGIRFLTETSTSPTLAAQMRSLLQRYPQSKWHYYQPVNSDHVLAGAELAFGQRLRPHYHLEHVAVGLAVDDDFLFAHPDNIRLAREFSAGRRVRRGTTRMSRWYALDTHCTITGAACDERLPAPRRHISSLLAALADRLGMRGERPESESAPSDAQARWLDALAADLKANRGACVVTVGDAQPPQVHALAHRINEHLDSIGRTVTLIEPAEATAGSHFNSIRDLVSDINSGQVNLLFILGGNPAYDAPGELEFAKAMDHVERVIHVGQYVDETARRSEWHIPLSHDLEAWSDARAADGTASIVQPLIEPLYFSRSLHQMLAMLMDEPSDDGHAIVQNYWRQWWESGKGAGEEGEGETQTDGGPTAFTLRWRRWLHDGFIPGTAAEHVRPALQAVEAQTSEPAGLSGMAGARGGSGILLDVQLAPDYSVWDGRFCNNAWLQELPRPWTKITWDNALLIAPADAEEHELETDDVVEISVGGRTVAAAVAVAPGHPRGAATLQLGYGRGAAGRVGNDVGSNAYPIFPASGTFVQPAAVVRRTDRRHRLVVTQEHHSMEGRDLVRVASLEEFMRLGGAIGAQPHGRSAPLYPEAPEGLGQSENAWGMSIDLSACIGCNACTIACQAENNIPVVGREQVDMGREMHWIRVDGYFEGHRDNPLVHHQPVPCMHCERAPCEVVCPVAATVHSNDGLNEMVYNRCVGTRYCSNNCPYKVRRFNFLLYNDWDDPLAAMQHNPNVSVRNRGVMEKCTYCVQRIRSAEIEARKDNRRIRDGEVVTACQAVCPTQAIVFGNLRDEDSAVSQAKAQPHDYALLEELNTRPRTTYLARVRNPNSDAQTGGGHGR